MSQAEVQSFFGHTRWLAGRDNLRHIERVRRRPVRGLYRHQRRVGGGNHRPVGPRLQGEPESAAHRDAEGAASGHCRRSQRLSAYGGDGVELSGYRRLRSRLCGFFRQVYGAAKRYRYYLEHEEQYGYTAHNLNYIQYHPTRHAAAHKCISRTRRPPCSTSIRPTSRTSPHWPLATVPAIPAPVMATATSRLSTPAGSVRREADNGS